jgi:hypothetical protein
MGCQVPLLGADVPYFTRQLANGAERLVIEASTPEQVRAVQKALHQRAFQVLELVKKPDQDHTKAILRGEGWHAVHPGFRAQPQDLSTWFLERWDLGPAAEHDSAAILLSDGEAERLRLHLAGLVAAGVITHPQGESPYNCAAIWTQVPIGEHGETLRELLGFSRELDLANSAALARALELGGNDRILASILYRPAQADFGLHPDRRVFR